MTTSQVRAILAISIVGGVFLVSAILAIAPSAVGNLQDMKEHLELLKEFSALFSGVVGTIIGYYFGKSDT